MRSSSKHIGGALALGVALLATTACHNEGRTTATKATATTEPSGLTKSDREFVTKAAQGGMLEVALGQHVSRNASSADVKDFGQRMVTDHSVADEELKNIAASKGVSIPTQLDSDHRATYDKLAKLQGTKLDSEYTEDMVDDHEEDVKAFDRASRELEDPELRAWAAKTLPTLEGHLATARDLKAKHR